MYKWEDTIYKGRMVKNWMMCRMADKTVVDMKTPLIYAAQVENW